MAGSARPRRQWTAPVVVGGRRARAVRTPPDPAAVSTRLGFALLERAAPEVGARWAERLWSAPPREADAGAAPGAVTGPGVPFVLNAGGFAVTGEAWGEGPAVHLVPGLGGDRDDLAAFVAPIVDRGHRVVAFDARFPSVPALSRALAAVVEGYGTPHAVVAHATGATAAAAALGDGVRLGRLAMLAPVPGLVSHARRFAARLGAGDRIAAGLLARLAERAGVPLGELDVPAMCGLVVTPPTLVVHDRDDADVPVTEAARIATSWPGSRLTVTAGRGHCGILRDPWVVGQVLDFVTTPDPRR